MNRPSILLSLLLAGACANQLPTAPPPPSTDAGRAADAGVVGRDAGSSLPDGGSQADDAGAPDASSIDAGDPDAGAGDGGVSPDAGTPASCFDTAGGCGFAAAISWPVPTDFPDQLRLIGDQDGCEGAGDTLHALVDMRGDGRPDLVVTSDCDEESPVGASEWLVYESSGAGFSPTPLHWSIPAGLTDYFPTLSDPWDCAGTGDLLHEAFDLDGDGAVELVVTDDCDGTTALGSSLWSVYRGTASGFSVQAVSWTIPAGYSNELGIVADQQPCAGTGDALHLLADLDGDGRLDLVLTNDCDDATGTGRGEWLFFRNDGTRFAPRPAPWALPQLHEGHFRLAEDQQPCEGTGDLLHGLLDLDGDGRPDLVATTDCDPATPLGASEWHLFRNTGAGFAPAPIAWSLPPDRGTELTRLFDQGNCAGSGDLHHGVLDLDGDGRPELVVTDDCDDATALGLAEWQVFRNTGAGFSPAPAGWTIPSRYGQQLDLFADQARCQSTGDILHASLDLDGDGRLDLVFSNDCDDSTPLGWSEWLVFSGPGAP